MITDCISVIDIGTDHGYLPIYMLMTGRAQKAVAADIRPGPLKNARDNIYSYGVQAETLLSDGFSNVKEKHSAAFICGMGGETIAEIIKNGGGITPQTLVLQPMTGADKLRKFLFENGYAVTDEKFVTEGEKVYCVIKARFTGANTEYEYADLFLGKIRPQNGEYNIWKQKIRLQAEKRMLGGENENDINLVAQCR